MMKSLGYKPGRGPDFGCEFCDSCGGEKTYDNQVIMPIGSRVVSIDYCIARVVAALNAAGIRTLTSCCGHGGPNPGEIILEDGRALVIRHWESRGVDGSISLCDMPPNNSGNHQGSSPELGEQRL